MQEAVRQVKELWLSLLGNPLQYSCLENPRGQRSLVGCSPRGHKESETTERLNTNEETLLLNNGFPDSSAGKESAFYAGDLGSIPGFEDLLEKRTATHSSILAWRMPWPEEATVFWPGEFHGQRSLAGYSPWGWKESDTTE